MFLKDFRRFSLEFKSPEDCLDIANALDILTKPGLSTKLEYYSDIIYNLGLDNTQLYHLNMCVFVYWVFVSCNTFNVMLVSLTETFNQLHAIFGSRRDPSSTPVLMEDIHGQLARWNCPTDKWRVSSVNKHFKVRVSCFDISKPLLVLSSF